jgi:hypothetical protein
VIEISIFDFDPSGDTESIKRPTMETYKARISILNDNDNPSFAARPAPRHSKQPSTTFYTQSDQSPSRPAAKRGYSSAPSDSPGHLCYDWTSINDATLAREFTTMQAVPEPLTLKTNKHKYPCPFAASHAYQAMFTLNILEKRNDSVSLRINFLIR